jgi:hypothetical protein
MQIIYNKYNKKQPTPKAISGPYTLTLLRNEEYNKNIYIFGEIHGYDFNCMDLCPVKCKNKQCPSGKTCNPTTGRCVKDMCKNKQCPHGKSCNTTTGRCVKEPNIAFEIAKKCDNMDIQDYLVELLKTTPVFIDLFIETQKGYDFLGERGKDFLSILRGMMRKCILRDKYKDIAFCKNARVHFVDVRWKYDNLIHKAENIFESSVIELETVKNKISEMYVNNRPGISSTRKILDKLREYRQTSDYDKFYNWVWDIIINTAYVKKELSRTYLRDKLIPAFKEELHQIVFDSMSFVKKFNNVEKFVQENDYVKGFMISINAIVLDIYLLCRVFKKYIHPNIDVNQPDEARNIIIYAGEAHDVSEKAILRELGFKTIFEYTPLDGDIGYNTRCLPVEKYTPLFTNLDKWDRRG